MATTNNAKKDHWNSEAYQSAAGYVPKLTTKVVGYLNAQPGDRILDLGCGDGVLTAQIASSAQYVLGVDASNSLLSTARDRYGSVANCTFVLHDATQLDSCSAAGLGGQADGQEGSWDKVFSNAALHWILRKPETRVRVFENVHRALKRGAVLVFEMGGHGNVAEIHAAATAALVHVGVPVSAAHEASPWFFPSVDWMRETLEQTGFDVDLVETEYRPSQLEAGALEKWVRLMCAEFLEVLGDDPELKERAVREICDLVRPVVTRVEDGSQWLGNVRLRAQARKK